MWQAETLLNTREYSIDSDSVLSVAHASGLTAYDAEFVSLAEQLQVKLVTSDKQIIKAFPKTAISPQNFSR